MDKKVKEIKKMLDKVYDVFKTAEYTQITGVFKTAEYTQITGVMGGDAVVFRIYNDGTVVEKQEEI